MVDRYWPVVASDVPVKLVVIFEKPDGILDGVIDFDCTGGVYCVGNVNFQVAKTAGRGRVVFQFVAVAVGNGVDFQKQRVVGAAWARIFDGNEAVNAVPLADKDQSNMLTNNCGAIGAYVDRVLKISHPPAFGGKRRGQSEQPGDDSEKMASRPVETGPAPSQRRGEPRLYRRSVHAAHGIRTSRPPVRGRPRLPQRTGATGIQTCRRECWSERIEFWYSGRGPRHCSNAVSSGWHLRSG